jgi:putative addiction module CopG family antidote
MNARRLSIELPEQVAELVDARIATGRNASESEVVREALELLAEQDEPREDWMAEELVAGYDAWRADPTSGIPLEEVSAQLDEERALRRAM